MQTVSRCILQMLMLPCGVVVAGSWLRCRGCAGSAECTELLEYYATRASKVSPYACLWNLSPARPLARVCKHSPSLSSSNLMQSHAGGWGCCFSGLFRAVQSLLQQQGTPPPQGCQVSFIADCCCCCCCCEEVLYLALRSKRHNGWVESCPCACTIATSPSPHFPLSPFPPPPTAIRFLDQVQLLCIQAHDTNTALHALYSKHKQPLPQHSTTLVPFTNRFATKILVRYLMSGLDLKLHKMYEYNMVWWYLDYLLNWNNNLEAQAFKRKQAQRDIEGESVKNAHAVRTRSTHGR